MFGIDNFAAFIISAVFFILTPGIDTICVLNKSISQGRKTGFYATLGINTGILVHTLFAALGLSIIIAKSAMAFTIIKYIGAAYLIYLGIMKLRSGKSSLKADTKDQIAESAGKTYLSGTMTNILNPKVALFFLAFFPQFIRPESINSPMPFIILGSTYALLGVLWLGTLTFFSSAFSEKLTRNVSFSKWMDRFSGIVFILMGLKVALDKR